MFSRYRRCDTVCGSQRAYGELWRQRWRSSAASFPAEYLRAARSVRRDGTASAGRGAARFVSSLAARTPVRKRSRRPPVNSIIPRESSKTAIRSRKTRLPSCIRTPPRSTASQVTLCSSGAAKAFGAQAFRRALIRSGHVPLRGSTNGSRQATANACCPARSAGRERTLPPTAAGARATPRACCISPYETTQGWHCQGGQSSQRNDWLQYRPTAFAVTKRSISARPVVTPAGGSYARVRCVSASGPST